MFNIIQLILAFTSGMMFVVMLWAKSKGMQKEIKSSAFLWLTTAALIVFFEYFRIGA